MVLPGLKTLKSLLSNSSHRRGNGTKKLKEKGDDSSDIFNPDAPKDSSPMTNKKAAGGLQNHSEMQANQKYNSTITLPEKLGGSPPLSHCRALGNGKNEVWSTANAGDYTKKGNSLPAGAVPPPYNSEELLMERSGDDQMVNRTFFRATMTTSATSPLLSDTSRNRTNWDSPMQKRQTINNGQENRDVPFMREDSESEKKDLAKESSENRIVNLDQFSENERNFICKASSDHDSYQNRVNGLSNSDVDQQNFERERLLRQAAEERLKEVTFEKDTFKQQVSSLQEEIRRKESELLSGALSQRDSNTNSKLYLDNKYERKLQNCQLNVVRLGKVNSLLVKEIRNLESVMSSLDQPGTISGESRTNRVLLERLKYLEAENASLVMESEQQRMLYERCLDDVANQVVQALLVQKSLQETCSKLKKRVDDLEQQNRTLHILFQQQLQRSWDPRSSARNMSAVSSIASPVHPNAFSSQFLHFGKKMVRSSSSSTSCSHSSSTSSQSPVMPSCSSDVSVSSDYSPISSSGKCVQSGAKSGYPEEHSLVSSNASRGNRIGGNGLSKSNEGNNSGNSDNIKVCWKESCKRCKEECHREECCSACSCNTPTTIPLHHQNHLSYFLPYIKEKRPPPHGPVMGMTDLLRLNYRKSVETNGIGLQDNRQSILKIVDNKSEGDVDMKLDNMKTPSDDDKLCIHKNLDLSNLSEQKAVTLTASNIKQNLKYKLYEDSSNGIVSTSWRGSYNPNCYTAALNAYQNSTPTLSTCQRPQHLKLCKHYTLPSKITSNKFTLQDYSYNFDKMCNSNLPNSKTNNEHHSVSNSICERNGDEASRLVTSQSTTNDGNESGLDSSEVSPKDSLLCSSVSEDQEDTTSKKSGAKDEGYSTMSSDIQCDGEVDDQSRRASINVSPDFLCYESPDSKLEDSENRSKSDHNSSVNTANQSEQKVFVQISSQPETFITRIDTNKSESSSVNKLLASDTRVVVSNNNSAVMSNSCRVEKKCGAFLALKENEERVGTFGSLSLLSVKSGHVESMKEKFESETKRESVSAKLNESEKLNFRSSCKCATNIPNSSDEKLLQKPHIIIDDDADVFYLPIYCPLVSNESLPKKSSDYLDGVLKRSQSDSCLHFENGAGKLTLNNNSYDSQRKLNHINYLAYHHSAWDLANHINEDLMALYRSKACLSLADDASQLGYLSPIDTAALGWHSSFSPASLNSLHSLCSGSGEASFLHEAPASRSKLSPVSIESSCLFSSSNDEDEINSSDDAWFLADSISSEKDYPTPLSETNLNYNDEEICNWSLNYSSEEICLRRTPEQEHNWDHKRSAMCSPSTHNGFYSRPTDSLPSIQEVDDDDGESFISLPSKRNFLDDASKGAEKRGRTEMKNRTRRREGTCNSWPSTNDRSSKVWCRANNFMERLHSLHPTLPLQNSDSVQTWGSSMRCLSDGLSDSHSKGLSVSSFGIGSEFASSPDSKCSVDQSVGALEENDASPLETHFTRDFYRLCKVESCRSLDVSCKSLTATPSNSREVQKENSVIDYEESVQKTHDRNIELQEKTNSGKFGDMLHQEKKEIKLSGADAIFGILSKEVDHNHNDKQEAVESDNYLFDKENEKRDDRESGNQSDLSIGKEGCTTSWVHFEADVDLSDPKARANLLDSMLASSTSSSDTELDSDTADDSYKYQHLHDIHRVRRFRRAFDREQCVVRYVPPTRPSILDRKDFFYRFGEQEKEAVASFDFLESMSTSISDVGSIEAVDGNSTKKDVDEAKSHYFGRVSFQSNILKHDTNRNSLPLVFNSNSLSDRLCKNRVNIFDSENAKFSALALSQASDVADRLSFSDSCAESFSCSYTSLNMEL